MTEGKENCSGTAPETCSGDDSSDGTIWATVSIENEFVGFDWQMELKSVPSAFCSSSGVVVIWLTSFVVAVVKESSGKFWWG